MFLFLELPRPRHQVLHNEQTYGQTGVQRGIGNGEGTNTADT